ncbi:hypothetical protein DFH11DRAFT_1582594 [Phellopilus nigrolimitatus]|nr:hypothetical protein DFH11DRAFT_1582594 [Phellopilus nigrolimitatus]
MSQPQSSSGDNPDAEHVSVASMFFEMYEQRWEKLEPHPADGLDNPNMRFVEFPWPSQSFRAPKDFTKEHTKARVDQFLDFLYGPERLEAKSLSKRQAERIERGRWNATMFENRVIEKVHPDDKKIVRAGFKLVMSAVYGLGENDATEASEEMEDAISQTPVVDSSFNVDTSLPSVQEEDDETDMSMDNILDGLVSSQPATHPVDASEDSVMDALESAQDFPDPIFPASSFVHTGPVRHPSQEELPSLQASRDDDSVDESEHAGSLFSPQSSQQYSSQSIIPY